MSTAKYNLTFTSEVPQYKSLDEVDPETWVGTKDSIFYVIRSTKDIIEVMVFDRATGFMGLQNFDKTFNLPKVYIAKNINIALEITEWQ